jgi:uncharacterized protein YbjT (DUF2867 family)
MALKAACSLASPTEEGRDEGRRVMTFAIVGVTGNTGKAAAEALLAKGKSIRIVVRDAAKGDAWRAKGAEPAVADLLDPAALGRALAGAEGAYLLIPPNMAAPDYRAYQDRTVDALAEAVKQSGVPHVVLLSSVGAQHAAGTGPIAALHRAEARLSGIAGTKLTALRAAYFMENLGGSLSMLGQGVLPSFLPKDFAFDMIAAADIGRLAADLLLEGRAAPGVVELGGPARSMSDAAAALTTIVGKPIAVHEAPLEAMAATLAGFGLPQETARLYQEMTGAMLSGHAAFEGGHRRVQGTTPLATVLRELVAGAK